MTGNVWVLAEMSGAELDDITFELLTKGKEIAQILSVELCVMILGHGVQGSAQKLTYEGVDEIILADNPALEFFNPDVYSRVIVKAINEFQPHILIMGHTYTGMDIGPSIAAKLNVGLVSNCVDIRIDDGRLTVIRSMYNGKIYAKSIFENPPPFLISVQKGVLSVEKNEPRPCRTTTLDVEIEEASLRTRFLKRLEVEIGEVDISKAEVLVAGGRGIREKEKLQLVEDLAKVLGGGIACSRPLVDMGWLPSTYQVGLSGRTVKPKLYIACGISGSSQHLAGMKASDVIVAINKDAKAPIFDVAHYGIVADLSEVVPLILEEVKKSMST